MSNFLSRGGWSWKRFLGIPYMKRRVMKNIGLGWMPLTKQGWYRKIGRMVVESVTGRGRSK